MSVPLTIFIDQYTGALLVGVSAGVAVLVSVSIFAPLIEEFSKAFPLFYRHGETERSIFKLALLVGVGFGLIEFLTYVLLLKVPVIDRLPGLFFHPASTSITAYGIATKRPGRYYAAAVALHFSNNLLSLTFGTIWFASPMPLFSSIVIVALTVALSWQLFGKTKERIIGLTTVPAETKLPVAP